MKKIAHILLLIIYTTASFGIGVKQFYCCGKLKSTDISFTQQASKEKCAKGMSMRGCCKTSFKHLQVKDSHIAADAITPPVKYFTYLHLFTPVFELLTCAAMPESVTNCINAPPPHKGVPVYVLHCVYRI